MRYVYVVLSTDMIVGVSTSIGAARKIASKYLGIPIDKKIVQKDIKAQNYATIDDITIYKCPL